MSRAKSDAWATTEEVAAAARASPGTVRRWARLGVLPAPELVHMGRRGNQARWPLHAPQQARWVASMLDKGHTFAEIAVALERGDFAPVSSDEEG